MRYTLTRMPHIDLLAVLLSAIAAMAVGSFWYSFSSPMGKIWLKEVGFKTPTPAEMMAKNKEAMRAMAIYSVGVFVTMYVYFHMLATYQTATYWISLQGAFFTWLGFFAMPGIAGVVFEQKSWKLYAVNQSFNLIMLTIASLIFVAMN